MEKNIKESILSSSSFSSELKEKVKSLENCALESIPIIYVINKLNSKYLLPLKEELPKMTKEGNMIVNICFNEGIRPSKETINIMGEYFFVPKKVKYINKIITNILYSDNPKKEIKNVFNTLV